jgi:ADP-ribose pyrophosphatase
VSGEDRRFEKVAEEVVYEGRIFDVVQGTYRFADGEEAKRDIVRSPGAVGIVAHDDEVLYLVRQPREAVDDPDVLEIPAGRLDKAGEDPAETAQRELAEEIGKRAGRLELLREYWTSTGLTSEEVFVFLGTDLSDAEADSGEMERIEIVRWPLADLDGALAATKDVKTILGLMLLRERLRADG